MSSLTCYHSKLNNKCFSGSNNIYTDLPPIMSDGRVWSAWQPEAVINNKIQYENNIGNNWTYRQFLQKNGLRILNFNTIQQCSLLGLEYNKAIINNMAYSKTRPYLYKNVFDTSKHPACSCQTSNLKSPYLTREQLNARLIAPFITPPMPIV